MKLLNTLSFIMNHPLNRKNKLGSLLCFIKWQFKSRLYKSEHIYNWVDKANFIINRGEHAMTGNLYCGLLEYEDMAFVLHSLKETDNFYDIGANVGSYTLLASGVKPFLYWSIGVSALEEIAYQVGNAGIVNFNPQQGQSEDKAIQRRIMQWQGYKNTYENWIKQYIIDRADQSGFEGYANGGVSISGGNSSFNLLGMV